VKKLRQLEEENGRMKQMVADLSLGKHMLQEVLLKKGLAPSERRELVKGLNLVYRAGIRRACGVVCLCRATYYKRPHRDDQTMLRMKIRDYAAARVRYGYLRIHILLRREGLLINKNRVYRLYCLENLNIRHKPKRKIASVPRIEAQKETRLNESWAMDFVSDQPYNGKRFRTLTVVDTFSRECLAIYVG
jgi:putative transposase